LATIVRRHFFRTGDRAQARDLFKLAVTRVNLETSSYCNRRCGYCPNAFIDRITDKKYMPDPVLDGILADLKEIDYDRDIVLHYYNEPLADPQFCDKVARTVAACPKANVEAYSNGDYLDRDMLENLRRAGLKTLVLSLHLAAQAPWSDAGIINRLTEICARLGKPARIESFEAGRAIIGTIPDRDIAIRIQHRNYYTYSGMDRGGLMTNLWAPEAHNLPCLQPFTDLYVAWDGGIFPCCNVHPDAEEHRQYRIGSVSDFPSIFQAYADSALVEWRDALAAPVERRPPCKTCALGVMDPNEAAAIRGIHQRAHQEGGE